MRTLLTGKNGQLGHELQRTLASLGDVVAVGQSECDLRNPEAIRELVRGVAPDVIVNAAAYTAVDMAEREVAAAEAVNARAPGVLGEEALRTGACVLHFSTDYVFDGAKQGFYTESDDTNPLGVYGRTKRDGERALQASGANHLIFRTSWIAGAHGNNFAKTMLRLAADRDVLNVVADQFGVPTSAAQLAQWTARALNAVRLHSADSFPSDLYHLVPSGETSWHEYACFVIDEARRAGKSIRVKPEGIKAIASADYPVASRRPANSRLDTTKFRRTFGLELPPWQSGIHQILQEII